MTVTSPIGEVRPEHDRATGSDLVMLHYVRGFAIPIVDVWERLTESATLPTWFGTVVEDSGGEDSGRDLQVALDDDCLQKTVSIRVQHCEAPHRADLQLHNAILEITLHQVGVVTTLEVVRRHLHPSDLPVTGPRLQFYLDRLDAALNDAPLPRFDAYQGLETEYHWVSD
ncbi:hypothetical protein FOS14_18255 [Skermania sp. ID1734]|uniref:hypothetical protein n=1 Tax=Skermania sp. ID1734 TaxID=2597516 RepID=UPI00117E7BF8|nr:hypothetical protein [Skermania sp. ID1734]TSD95304.1 hypothetical protein FOS14_18255 [Skermania sp. ID1734]